MLHNTMGGGACGDNFPGKRRYGGIRFNTISITRGWVSNFPKKAMCITCLYIRNT